MSSYLAFGERISSFMLQDAAHLHLKITPPKQPDISNRPTESGHSTASSTTWHSRAVKHAKLVKQGLALSRSRDEVTAKKHKKRPKPQLRFRLHDLPAEIRHLIFAYVFKRTSGREPKLLWAFRGNPILWESARRVYWEANNFSIMLENGWQNKRVERMPDELLKLIRNLTVVVPKTIQHSVDFTTRLVLSNIRYLTLQVSTESGLRIAAHNVIPKFPQIERLTVAIKNARDRWTPQGRTYRAVILNSYREAIMIIDRMLGVEGKTTESAEHNRKKLWVWEALRVEKGGKRFKMNLSNNHVKFD